MRMRLAIEVDAAPRSSRERNGVDKPVACVRTRSVSPFPRRASRICSPIRRLISHAFIKALPLKVFRVARKAKSRRAQAEPRAAASSLREKQPFRFGEIVRSIGIEVRIDGRGGKIGHRDLIARRPVLDLPDALVEDRAAQLVMEAERPKPEDGMPASAACGTGKIGADSLGL